LCWQQPSGVEGGKAGQQNNTGIPKWRDPASTVSGANAKKRKEENAKKTPTFRSPEFNFRNIDECEIIEACISIIKYTPMLIA
jgi:hypothetical protein